MRAEAVSWDDWSMGNPPPTVDNDKWHVQFSSDEVKVVSLEQLDDLFRLSIVDSETQVWQTGMAEWQPLRVIAGLEEQPAPPVKRAPPKPPTRTASPSVRPAPPPPKPDEFRSVRPAAPAPRSAPPPAARPAHLAPASFYPEPTLAAPASYRSQTPYAAPIAFAATMPATNSVRPLVVSQAPPMVQRGGGGFGRFLVGLALLTGVGVTAYRNDFLREGAHAAHQDALYARLEAALGGPAFGTVRALEQNAAAQSEFDGIASETAVRIAIPTPSAALSTPPSSTGNSPSELAPAAAAPPVVSLASLAREKKDPATAAAPLTAVAPAPARAVVSVQPKQATAPVPAKPQAVRPSPAPKAAVEKPAPVAQKSSAGMSDRELLNAAIGQSVMMQNSPSKAKSKPKAKGNEYDPLNPSL
jgi:hypothetical protein